MFISFSYSFLFIQNIDTKDNDEIMSMSIFHTSFIEYQPRTHIRLFYALKICVSMHRKQRMIMFSLQEHSTHLVLMFENLIEFSFVNQNISMRVNNKEMETY
jgi:hypothetical protein